MIALYDNTGLITQVLGVYPPNYAELLNERGASFVEVPDDIAKQNGFAVISRYYVSDGLMTERPELPLPDSVTLSVGEVFDVPDLPPCSVNFDDQTFQVSQGQFRFDATAPGEYPVFVSCFPYRDKLVKVIVE